MWIILEGADAVGKSTVASQLHQRYPSATILHLGPPDSPGRSLDQVLEPPVATYVPGSGEDIFCDRWHWGDPVYGPIYRPDTNVDGYGDMGRSGWRYSELFVESRGGATFLLRADPDKMAEKFTERGDDYALASDLAAIASRYEELAAESVTFTGNVEMTLDPSWPGSEDADDTIDWLIDEARAKESQYSSLGKFKHYVGPYNPAILVVCKPDRDLRLQAVNTLADDLWPRVGIASTAMSLQLLEELLLALERPMTLGLGVIPAHLAPKLDELVSSPSDVNSYGKLAIS